MTKNLRAVYLGNTNDEYGGFTVGKEYEIHDFVDGYVGAYDDNASYLCIKNGAFHLFMIKGEFDGFVTEIECAATATENNKKPYLRYYINGHEVDVTEFESVSRTVYGLDRDGVKCDTIKFEVKFE